VDWNERVEEVLRMMKRNAFHNLSHSFPALGLFVGFARLQTCLLSLRSSVLASGIRTKVDERNINKVTLLEVQ
jgi:hypothetical protein